MKAGGFDRGRLLRHFVMIAVGMALAWRLEPGVSSQSSDGERAQGQAWVQSRGQAVTARSSPNRSHSGNYREAWELLLAKRLPSREKAELMGALIEEWAEKDVDGALEAYMEEGGEGMRGVFNDLMEEHPERFWPAIRDQRFGLATWELRESWLRSLAHGDPMRIFEWLEQMDPVDRVDRVDRVTAVALCFPRNEENPALKPRLLKLPDTPVNREIWKEEGKRRSLFDGIDADWWGMLDATPPAERWLRFHEISIVVRTSEGDAADARGLLEKVPEEMREAIAWNVLQDAEQKDYRAFMGMVDYFVEIGKWDVVGPEAKRMELLSNPEDDAAAAELMAWVSTMPEQEGMVELYDRAANSILVGKEMPESLQWLAQLPEGWQRDRAAAAYAVEKGEYAERDEIGPILDLISDEDVANAVIKRVDDKVKAREKERQLWEE